ncbi:MAG: DNA double-strand break repair nuclease NurA [Thermoproteales archaeon]|nr:DNA double-strand break repair nuclease NurA [Thermoproteales archaeon]
MPRFLDLYVEKIRNKKEAIKNLLSYSEDTLKFYKEIFRQYWRSLPRPVSSDAEIFAIDSSDGLIECREGITIHVCRALALSNNGIELRELEVYPFYSTSSIELVTFRSRVREHLEHVLALKCIEKFSSDRKLKVVILDGSLYGRMAHLPKDLEIPGHEDFMLDYIEIYHRLFVKAREKNVVIVGLSKDSRSRVYRRIMLFEEIIRRMQEKEINSSLYVFVREIWNDVWRNPKTALKKLDQVLGVPEWIKEILKEILKPRPDVQVISTLANDAGYILPALLKTPAPALDSLINAIKRNQLLEYIDKGFQKSFIEKGFKIYDKALRILPKILEYPDIVMFYLVPRKRDIPIRVDVPKWVVSLKEDDGSMKILRDVDDELSWIISMLVDMYAGPRHYNVLMEQVDAKVKFKLQDIINVYEPLLSKELDFLIEHTRDMRRVRYP